MEGKYLALNRNMQTPFYDPAKTYEDNYKNGPFGIFSHDGSIVRNRAPQYDLFGHKIFTPFGIPAGPLLNAKFVKAAFSKGFDVCVYKTVRTREYKCHAWPNILSVHSKGRIEPGSDDPLLADSRYTARITITNSFGVPSMSPEIWQPDMRSAIESAGPGQVMVGSFQGTTDGSGDIHKYIQDFVLAAKMVKETGAKILEANLSCPNEGTSHMLCFDTERTALIVEAIRKGIGSTPLILKLAYFDNDEQLEKLVRSVGHNIDGLSAVNTISMKIVNRYGKQALPGQGRERSGVCGHGIRWTGLSMVKRLKLIREKLGMNFKIIGVGGVASVSDFNKYLETGADVVMSATGAMWNPLLAYEIEASNYGKQK
jgi:dihydroorotate dehydrogenase (NAD+) catalytic subunit